MLLKDANEVVKLLLEKNYTISVAESCTGGMLCSAITDLSGASSVFNAGIITYSNEAKMRYLGVKEETLKNYGAVSKFTALEMAEGIKKANNAHIGVGITGIAGPTGDTSGKPVGLVYICVNDYVTENHFKGNRQEVRTQAVEKALKMVLEYINKTEG